MPLRPRHAAARALLAAAAIVTVMSPPAPAAAANALGRDDEPVVLGGSSLPPLLGAAPSRVVAFRYAAGWVPVPVQVDERTVVDFGTIYNSTPMGETVLAYADAGTFTGPDPDPTLDADDEIALRARDAGGQAPPGTLRPAGTVDGTGVEVTVRDPIGAGTAWIYLFESDGTLDPSAGVPPVAYVFDLLSGDYKTTYGTTQGPNPENSTVTTASYTVHFSDRWIRDGTAIHAGGASGADILDRHKNLFSPGDCQRSEATFSAGEGAFIVNRTGPVRALRGYVGANSGVTTYRVHAFYPAEEVVQTVLRVHPIPGMMDYFDYAPAAAGMRYLDNLNTGGVAIDGVPDAVTAGTLDWEMVTGAQGTLVHTLLVDTDIAGFATTSYYSDTTSPTTTQCTGDKVEYGASGFWRDAGIPNTDPSLGTAARMSLTRVIRYGPPNETLAYAQQRALEAHDPLAAQAAPWTPGTTCPDADRDGYAVCSSSCTPAAGVLCGDCDDGDASVHPGATEVCNGIDDNCNGAIDDGVEATFHRDADGDGYGDPAVTAPACTAPAGYVVDGTDCDDGEASIHPGAPEICGNGIDDNCNGAIDAADPECALPACPDADGDGYAVCSASCMVTGATLCGDCDDANAAVHPGAAEICGNGIDDNCDGYDLGCGPEVCPDADGDRYDVCGSTCVPAPGDACGDCDDTHPSVHPGAPEVCNGIDDNCDGAIDEGVAPAFHRDADGDGYGSPATTVAACSAPPGYVVDGTDCNDGDPHTFPGAPDLCGDGIDEDCDGVVDVSLCQRYDVNGDGRVDGLDLAILGRAFGACSPDPSARYRAAADYTRDGCVGGDDLALLASAWACVSGEDLCRR